MPERFVFLDRQRNTIRLVGLGLSNRKLGDKFSSLGKSTDQRLARLMRDGPWKLAPVSKKPNAYGECLVYAQTASGKWIQKDILNNGMAYVITTPADAFTPRLLAQESAARQRNRGFWRAREDIIRNVRTVSNPRYINDYQIVEGSIRFARDDGHYKSFCLANDPPQSVCFMVLHTAYNALRDRGIDLFSISRDQPVQMRGNLVYREGLKMYIRNPMDIQLVAAANTSRQDGY